MRTLLAPLLAAAALAGCYTGPGVDSPAVLRTLPDGVLPSPAPTPSGIWGVSLGGAYECCWLAADARFSVAVPATATRLRLMVSLPDIGPYDARPETLTARIDGGSPTTFGDLRRGIYALDVPLAAGTARQAQVHLTPAYTWLPPGYPPILVRSLVLRSARALGPRTTRVTTPAPGAAR